MPGATHILNKQQPVRKAVLPVEILEVGRSCPASSMRAVPLARPPFPPNRAGAHRRLQWEESLCTDARIGLAPMKQRVLETNRVKSASNSRGTKVLQRTQSDCKAMYCWGLWNQRGKW